ncbi:SAVED domain-containing protein [Aureimonas pseudogalii]|uniref:SMODS-associated and fused to various effectors domain-containing protein n=1 Tax=Aureimonas pseudogalii TaxID=1744844 RepID=A0A7W6H5U0_9HYPH|nr:SAVED domain-containing protein [Aureimonas pseudogalii]MBB3999093.1 hypothetical protein [Aureimonas pseudogalii]
MAKTNVGPKKHAALWAFSAGRCQYRGCNRELVGDLISGNEDGTFGFVAHVVADSAQGPRGDPVRSPELAKSLENLMLLCATHHKLIDVEEVEEHSEAVLLEMKREHEERIAIVADMDPDRASHVVRFAADIGGSESLVSTKAILSAMPPDHHPASRQTIDLSLVSCAYKDDEEDYWHFQAENLRRHFDAKVRGRVEVQEIRNLNVFALAPQPLLMELGRLIGDIVPAVVHQRHREPATWRWQPGQPAIRFVETVPGDAAGRSAVALRLALSATVTDDRITAVLGDDVAIWSLTAEDPHNDIMRRPQDLSEFKRRVRTLLDRIKAVHGEGAEVNIFPALPNSAAVEFGRARMPKADLPMRVWDQNRTRGGFIPTLRIG